MISAVIRISLRRVDISVICHVQMHCLGSFLWQDLFFKSLSICFLRDKLKRLSWTFFRYLHCILWRRGPPVMVISACKCSTGSLLSQISYLPSCGFLRRHQSFTLRKLHACPEKLCFFQLSDRTYVSGAQRVGLFLLWSSWHHRIQM